MSDYLFMLESHLTPEQMRVLTEVQNCAAELNISLFLTGGAMRDMLAGFPVRDLDFSVEGSAIKLAKVVAARLSAETVSTDDTRKSVELRTPGGMTLQISMAREEKYAKPGGKPSVHAATIHEDLRGRDFSVNAIGLSLNRASRGLLLDPTNGLGDIQSRELRAVSNYAMYDDPARLLRLVRFRIRMGYTVAERTASQYANVREAGLESKITQAALGAELRAIADEDKAGEILTALAEEGLLERFLPGLAGPKLNPQGFAKLHKARELVPFGLPFPVRNLGLFLYLLFEKLTPKERAQLVANTGLDKSEVALGQKLEPAAKKLQTELKAAKLTKPSRLYDVVSKAPGELILYLLVKSPDRIVHDRLKNYLQKYMPLAQEVTDKEVSAAHPELTAGTPKFEKAKREMIAQRLDARPKKVEPPPEVEPPPPPPPQRFGTARG